MSCLSSPTYCSISSLLQTVISYHAAHFQPSVQNGTAFCPISNEKITSISDPVPILDQIGPIFDSKHADVAKRFGSSRLTDRLHPPVHLCPALTTQTEKMRGDLYSPDSHCFGI